MSDALMSLPTRLRCEVAIPSGVRQGRVLVQLREAGPDLLELLPAATRTAATHQIVNTWGKPLLTHLSQSDVDMCGELSRRGFWEFAESMALVGIVRPGMTVVDAGAHIGYYSVLLAHTLGAAGKVFAFEPEPRNIRVLAANALLLRQLYPEAAPIAVLPYGLSDQVGSVRLNVYDENSGMHSLVHGVKKAVEMVHVTTMDSLVDGSREWSMEGRIDLIKADVCGSELALLNGAERILRQDQPIVSVNFESAAAELDKCINVLERLQVLGYAAFRIFNARNLNLCQTLAEAARIWTAGDVIDQVRRKLIGAHTTLLAFPVARQIASAPVYERKAAGN